MHFTQEIAGVTFAWMLISCGSSCRENEGPLVDKEDSTYMRVPAIDRMKTLLDLLKLRHQYKTDRMDEAIRFLAAPSCGGELGVPSWIDNHRVDDVFPLENVAHAVWVDGCGELMFPDGSTQCGSLVKAYRSCVPRKPNRRSIGSTSAE